LPVIISVYKDRSFDFIVKSPPVAFLLKRAANLAKASPEAGKQVIGEVTKSAVKEIAKEKLVDLNTTDIEQAVKIVEGTARSCGIKVVGG